MQGIGIMFFKLKNTVKLKNSEGFTLLELLLALAIFMIVIGAAYSTFLSQQKSYMVQEQVADMQQNIRAGMFVMQRELRMAGYDPIPHVGLNPDGITALSSNQITFEYINDTNNPNTLDTVSYSLYTSQGRQNLGRSINGSQNYAIADNIDALDFVFFDRFGAQTTSPTQVVSVQITIVARANRDDLDYTNTISYKNASGTEILAPQNDRRRRRLLTTRVKCRNLSLP
jgi:type IV pilus assembly protein PilW